ncbi:hypothetical protein ACFOD4_22050 [Pseudoroseomonas globiformis]|uniref:Entericidin EcnAB n=1 Tax=Teichococcus globiformis TaxID=2307229 RepID=A0ABV7G4X1_9PROT
MRLIMAGMLGMLLLAGCERGRPMERTGEALDRAGSRTGTALGGAAQATGGALSRAGHWMEQRVEPAR